MKDVRNIRPISSYSKILLKLFNIDIRRELEQVLMNFEMVSFELRTLTSLK